MARHSIKASRQASLAIWTDCKYVRRGEEIDISGLKVARAALSLRPSSPFSLGAAAAARFNARNMGSYYITSGRGSLGLKRRLPLLADGRLTLNPGEKSTDFATAHAAGGEATWKRLWWRE